MQSLNCYKILSTPSILLTSIENMAKALLHQLLRYEELSTSMKHLNFLRDYFVWPHPVQYYFTTFCKPEVISQTINNSQINENQTFSPFAPVAMTQRFCRQSSLIARSKLCLSAQMSLHSSANSA